MSVISTIHSASPSGMSACDTIVEATVSGGGEVHLVGLADASVRESLLRTVTALQASGYRLPGKKIVINLAPADLHKSGNWYDLPIALALLAATGQANLPGLDGWLAYGELSLDGKLRFVPSCLQAVLLAKELGLKGAIIPKENADEVRPFVGDFPVYALSDLGEALRLVSGKDAEEIRPVQETPSREPEHADVPSVWDNLLQDTAARRALLIAAAGGHDMLLVGPDGSCKEPMGKALAELLPPMSLEERLEAALIRSASGRGLEPATDRRPVRAPHCSVSLPALVGGGYGDRVLPGEVTLASGGVLFLDDYAELPKGLVEALRGPMEDGKVVISRLRHKITYPTRFQLVAACKPCPCGHYGDGDGCRCTAAVRKAYLSRLAGPVTERIALQVWVHPVRVPMGDAAPGWPSLEEARKAVLAARNRQAFRYMDEDGIRTNDDLTAKEIERFIQPTEEEKELLGKLFSRLGLSVRSYAPILKLARTIADLDGAQEISTAHVIEAAGYRFLDRHDLSEESIRGIHA